MPKETEAPKTLTRTEFDRAVKKLLKAPPKPREKGPPKKGGYSKPTKKSL